MQVVVSKNKEIHEKQHTFLAAYAENAQSYAEEILEKNFDESLGSVYRLYKDLLEKGQTLPRLFVKAKEVQKRKDIQMNGALEMLEVQRKDLGEGIIESIFPMFQDMAKKYRHRLGRQYEDMLQMVRIETLHAADLFNPRTGNKFSTYCIWWYRATLFDCLKKLDKKESFETLMSTINKKDIKEDYLVYLREREPNQEEKLGNRELSEEHRYKLMRMTRGLSNKEKFCLYARIAGYSLDAVGRHYDISRERVRQIVNGVGRKMRIQDISEIITKNKF